MIMFEIIRPSIKETENRRDYRRSRLRNPLYVGRGFAQRAILKPRCCVSVQQYAYPDVHMQPYHMCCTSLYPDFHTQQRVHVCKSKTMCSSGSIQDA